MLVEGPNDVAFLQAIQQTDDIDLYAPVPMSGCESGNAAAKVVSALGLEAKFVFDFDTTEPLFWVKFKVPPALGEVTSPSHPFKKLGDALRALERPVTAEVVIQTCSEFGVFLMGDGVQSFNLESVILQPLLSRWIDPAIKDDPLAKWVLDFVDMAMPSRRKLTKKIRNRAPITMEDIPMTQKKRRPQASEEQSDEHHSESQPEEKDQLVSPTPEQPEQAMAQNNANKSKKSKKTKAKTNAKKNAKKKAKKEANEATQQNQRLAVPSVQHADMTSSSIVAAPPGIVAPTAVVSPAPSAAFSVAPAVASTNATPHDPLVGGIDVVLPAVLHPVFLAIQDKPGIILFAF